MRVTPHLSSPSKFTKHERKFENEDCENFHANIKIVPVERTLRKRKNISYRFDEASEEEHNFETQLDTFEDTYLPKTKKFSKM